MKYSWPVSNTHENDISSPYGERISPITGVNEFHKGVDIAAPKKTPVLAISDCLIAYVSSEPDEFMGNFLVYETLDGIRVNYFHLHSFAKKISSSNLVKKGEIVGYVGKSGATTGNHLHFQVARKWQVAGESFDPMELFTEDNPLVAINALLDDILYKTNELRELISRIRG